MNREQKPINVNELSSRKKATIDEMIDNGKGVVRIWLIQNCEKIEYPKEMYGQLFSQDAYIVCM